MKGGRSLPEMQHVQLRKFKPEELIFNENETKEVLKFFYPNQSAFIEQAVINDSVRGFSQALMVEAVDASYALGFIKIVYDVFYMKPPTNFRKVLTKFGRKAAPHWFKHATATDMINAKIYDAVKNTIARNFRSSFEDIINGGSAMNKPIIAVIAYSKVNYLKQKIVWG